MMTMLARESRIMIFLQHFWAPRKAFKPVGMFTEGHMFLLIICLSILVALVFSSRNIKKNTIEKITKLLAIVMVILEGIKVIYSFYWGYTWINAWFPIAYCSIFMYALLLRGYGKGKWKRIGEAFLAGGCIIGGTAFLLFPSTSLMMYPVFHYQCLYSMFFHTLMIYMGIMYIWKMDVEFNKNSYKDYCKIYLFFAVTAIILNTLFDSNLMLLKKPFKIPVLFVHKLFKDAPWLYTIFVFLVYLGGPYWITAYFTKVIRKRKNILMINKIDEVTL